MEEDLKMKKGLEWSNYLSNKTLQMNKWHVIIFFLLPVITSHAQFYVELDEQIPSIEVTKLVNGINKSDNQAILVFETDLNIKYSSLNEDLKPPILSGKYQILLVNARPNAISLTYNNNSTVLNYGMLVENSKPALKPNELKYFKTSLIAELEIIDITEIELRRGNILIPVGANVQDALISIKVSPINLELTIVDENKQITKLEKEGNEYRIYLSTIDLKGIVSKNKLILTQKNGQKREINIFDLKPKETRFFEVRQSEFQVFQNQQQKLIDSSSFTVGSRGNLYINTVPSGALISINELETSYKTPFSQRLRSGFTKIRLIKEKYVPFDTLINMQKDSIYNLNINLMPEWADLTVHAEPKNSQILINNKIVGIGDIELKGISKGLEPGIYDLKVSLEKHKSFSEKIHLRLGESKELKVKIEPITGRLKIASTPEGTDIFLNGGYVGQTPFDKDIMIGEYQMTTKKEGFKEETKSFKIFEGEKVDFDISMLKYSDIIKPLKAKEITSYLIGAIGLGVGTYFNINANQNYSSYQLSNNPSEAAELRRMVEFADKLSPISLAVGSAGIIGGIFYSTKNKKIKSNNNLSIIPFDRNGVLSFKYNF
jgi:hypothetical protein